MYHAQEFERQRAFSQGFRVDRNQAFAARYDAMDITGYDGLFMAMYT